MFLFVIVASISKLISVTTIGSAPAGQRLDFLKASPLATSSSRAHEEPHFSNNARQSVTQVNRCLESEDKETNLIIYSSCRMASLLKSQLSTKGFVPKAVSFQSCLGQSLYSIYEVAVFLEQFADFAKWPSLIIYTDVQHSSPVLSQLWKSFSVKTKNVNIFFAGHNTRRFFQLFLTSPTSVILLCSVASARALMRKVSEEYSMEMFETPNRWLIISEVDPSILLQGISISFESNIIVATMNYFNDKTVLATYPFKAKEVLVKYTDGLNVDASLSCHKLNLSATHSINMNLSIHLFEVYDHLEDGLFNIKPIGNWFPEDRRLDFRYSQHLLRPLDGVHLTLAVIPSVPLTTVVNDSNGKLKMGAVTEDIFTSLSAKMNFSYDILVPADGSYGVKEDTGWTGMVGLVARKEANLTGTLSIVSPDRIEVLDYAPLVKLVTYGIMYLKPNQDPWDFTFFWSIFHPLVWLGVLAMIAIVTVIMFLTYQSVLLERRTMASFDHEPVFMQIEYTVSLTAGLSYEFHFRNFLFLPSCTFYVPACLCFTLVIFFHGGATMPPKHTTSTLIVFYAFEIFCVLIYTTYSSNITSILTTKRTILPFDNLQELADHPDYGIVLLKATNVVEMLKKSTKGPFHSAWKKIAKDTKKSFVSSYLEGIERVKSSKVGFIAPEEILGNILKDTICDYQFTSQPVEQFGIQFAYSKDFPFQKIFSSYIATMQETGLLYRLFKESEFSRHRPSCSDSTTVQSFELKKIIGLFVILAFGIFLASIVTGMEWFIYKQMANNENINQSLFHIKTIQATV